MVKLVLLLITMPLIITLILTIIYPKESLIIGRRWKYKNDYLEPSENAIKYQRIVSIVALFFLGILIIFS